MSADHYITDSDMKAVADAIRTKGGTTAPLSFPTGMVQAIYGIQGGHEMEDGFISGTTSSYVNDTATSIRSYMSYRSNALQYVNISNATTVGAYAFYFCGNLRSANFRRARDIQEYAMSYCTSLKSAVVPQARTIGDYAFYGCNALLSMDLPNATSIGENAFDGCTSMTTVKLAKATSILDFAFYDCSSLTKLIIGTRSVASAGNGILDRANQCQIYVPDNLVNTYRNTQGWRTYSSRIHKMSELPANERL